MTGASLPVRDLKRSSRPGLGRLRPSKMKPPPLPVSSLGKDWWKEKLKMRTTRLSASVARPCNFSEDNMSLKAFISAGRGMGSLTL